MRNRIILCVAVCVMLISCKQTTTPDSGGGGTTVNKPTINSFTVSPATIKQGDHTEIQWDTSGATTVQINQGIGPVSRSGQMQITPKGTTTYTLTASNSAGSVYKECRVEVE